MKKITVTLLVLLYFLFASASVIAGQIAKPISMVQLIANPSSYNNKLIAVDGYLAYSPQGNKKQGYLYFTKDDFLNSNSSDAISVELPDSILDFIEKYEDEFVQITGVFDANDHGPWGFYVGALKSISDVQITTEVASQSKYRLHNYALPVIQVENTDPVYEKIRNLSLSWLKAIQKHDYETIALDFDLSNKQTKQLKDKDDMQRANWLLFDSKHSVFNRFKGIDDLVFVLYKHTEPRYGDSFYACMYSRGLLPDRPYQLTNEMPGIYGSDSSVCVDIMKTDDRLTISFLPFISASMQ